MNTNLVSEIAQAAPQVQSAFSAWHIVVLGAGIYIGHAFHSVRKAGGIKTILAQLWRGEKFTDPGELSTDKPATK
jgi:hypothetical protein